MSRETDSELAAEPLRALRRGLTRAGGFSLYIAIVKTPAQRNQLINLLQEAMPATKLQTVAIRPDTADILDEVLKQLGNQITGPVMLVGLEDAVSTDASNHPILNGLNLRRTDWPLLVRQPVVFWVPEYLLGIFGRAAPDFLDWRSNTLHFPDMGPTQLKMLLSSTWGGGLDTRMPAAARSDRIKELESRITANEDSHDPVIRSTVVEWLNELGLHLKLLGRTKEAFRYFEKCLFLASKFGDRRGESVALGNLGTIYSSWGDMRKSIELNEQALKIDREIGHRLGESQDLGSLGVAYANLGDLPKAIELFGQGWAINHQIGYRNGEANSIGNLANANLLMGEPRKAAELYQKQLLLVREIGDRQGESNALGNLGSAYLEVGELRKAAELYEQSLLINRSIGNRHGEAADLGNLGLVYYHLGDSHRALELYEQQLSIAREIGDLRGEGHALFNSSLAFEKLNDRTQAFARIEDALKIFEKIEEPKIAKVRAMLAEWNQTAPPVSALAENSQK